MNRLIDLEEFSSMASDYAIGHTVRYADSTPSTMSMAKQYVNSTSGQRSDLSGTIFVTEEQSAGRGRRSRGWDAPHGKSVLVSALIQQPHLPRNPALLAMIAGVAATRAIEKFVTPSFVTAPSNHARLKWPNDLLLQLNDCISQSAGESTSGESTSGESVAKMGKVGGILIESAFRGNELQYAIIGIGINVNQTIDELPPPPFGAPKPTSIRLYLEKAVNRTELLVGLCKELSTILTEYERIDCKSVAYPDAMHPQDEAIYHAWRSRLDTINKQVSIYDHAPASTYSSGRADGVSDRPDPMPAFSGKAVDVTADGDLIIEDDQGNRQSFSAGDVSVRTRLSAFRKEE